MQSYNEFFVSFVDSAISEKKKSEVREVDHVAPSAAAAHVEPTTSSDACHHEERKALPPEEPPATTPLTRYHTMPLKSLQNPRDGKGRGGAKSRFLSTRGFNFK